MSAPERIWVCPDDETWQAGNWDLASDGMENEAEYIRAKAQREEAVARAALEWAVTVARAHKGQFVESLYYKGVNAGCNAIEERILASLSEPATLAAIVAKAEGGYNG